MNMPVEHLRNTFAAAIVAASLGEVGVQNALASTPEPIEQIAGQIASQPQTIYKDNTASASFVLSGETADLSFRSPRTINGKPDPAYADQIDMNVSLSGGSEETPAEAPIITIKLDKNKDGTWNAEETVGMNTSTTSNLSEYAGRSVVKYVHSPQGKVGYTHKVSKKDALTTLSKVEKDASDVAGIATQGESIYVDNGHVIGATVVLGRP